MLQLIDICKNYNVGKTILPVLNNINLTFKNKEFVAILGPSGCGKTTLLNLIGGLDQYTSGELLIDNKSTREFKDGDWDAYRNHRVGFVFQNYNLIMHLSIRENVELSLNLAGVNAKERKERAIAILNKVGLETEINKKPNQLSGGQMQRVAIARALINNPDILLADEPTGALDSQTSVQIMKLLKELAREKLVIMVTHNQELADTYATRIITMKDGQICDAPKPIKRIVKDNVNKETNKKTSMSFWSALRISFKNILTKKGRTITTAIAGSFGIVGVALVLAISNGFNQYVERFARDTLSNFPIMITQTSYDPEVLYGRPDTPPIYPDGEEVLIKDESNDTDKYAHFNKFNDEYMTLLNNIRNDNLANDVKLTYNYRTKLIKKIPHNSYDYKTINTDKSLSIYSSLSGNNYFTWQEMIGDEQFMLSQYDIIGKDSHFPRATNEIALVVDRYNRISRGTLENLGLIQANVATKTISFEEILDEDNTCYYLVPNDVYFNDINEHSITVPDILSPDKEKKLALYSYPDTKPEFDAMIENEASYKLKVTCILRAKESSSTDLMNTGLLYLPALSDVINNLNKNSQVALDMANAYASPVEGTFKFYNVLGSNAQITDNANGDSAFVTFLKQVILHQYDFTNDPLYNYLLENPEIAKSLPDPKYMALGYIQVYPKDFSAKKEILKRFDDYNNKYGSAQEKQIFYSDPAKTFSESLSQLISLISTVLIAFSSISLIVSSVMIGVITYVSVIERTKEIGVLRAMGARKRDVGRLFTAETFIIGFVSGSLGVVGAVIISWPVNLLLNSLYPGQGLGKIAVLHPVAAIVLIGISVLLTIVSGLFPSHLASKKKPVEALRSE